MVSDRGLIHNKRYFAILQPTQVSLGLNSRDLQHFVFHHVRGAVVSGNTFDVPLKTLERFAGIFALGIW